MDKSGERRPFLSQPFIFLRTQQRKGDRNWSSQSQLGFLRNAMAGSGSSMLYSFLLFTVILSLQEMYRGKLASTELFTIAGGFISSLLFLASLTVNP